MSSILFQHGRLGPEVSYPAQAYLSPVQAGPEGGVRGSGWLWKGLEQGIGWCVMMCLCAPLQSLFRCCVAPENQNTPHPPAQPRPASIGPQHLHSPADHAWCASSAPPHPARRGRRRSYPARQEACRAHPAYGDAASRMPRERDADRAKNPWLGTEGGGRGDKHVLGGTTCCSLLYVLLVPCLSNIYFCRFIRAPGVLSVWFH